MSLELLGLDWTDVAKTTGDVLKGTGALLEQAQQPQAPAGPTAAQLELQREQLRAEQEQTTVEWVIGGLVVVAVIVAGVVVALVKKG